MAQRVNRRSPISCEPCRSRKIRCPPTTDSSGPCASCIRRGLQPSQCVYLRYRHVELQQSPSNGSQASNEELLDRIRALEDVVRGQNNVVGAGSTAILHGNLTPISPYTQASSSSPSAARFGALAPLSAGKLRHLDGGYQRFEPHGSQWSSILDSSHHEVASHDLEASVDDSLSNYPFDLGTGVTLDDLIAQLPPQKQCDELKNVFLNVFASLFHILHNPTFETQYAHFQHDPRSASLSWLALLYTILSIAVTALNESTSLLSDLSRKQSTSQSIALLSSRYRKLAMQCLQADQFLWRHTICTLQTLVLLIYGINHTHGRTWALLGTTYNIAVALGCHVDPESFQLSLVEQEERRRCWAGVMMLFTVQNTSMGNLDQRVISNTVKAPMDVNDADLSREAGLSDVRQPATQMSYLLYKFRLYDISAKICKGVFGTARPSYPSILALEQEILMEQAAWDSRYAVDTQSRELPIYHKFHLNILYSYSHQLVLLLHRPCVGHTQNNLGFAPNEVNHSKNRCIDSAKSILHIHELLFSSAEYASFRWYNEGLGSFHAFHAHVVLFVLLNEMEDSVQSFELKSMLKRSLSNFTVMAERSRLCANVAPVLSHLSLTSEESSFTESRFDDTVDSDRRISPETMARTLEPYQWLSPSNMAWDDWNSLLGIG